MSPRGLRHELGQLLFAGFTGTSIPADLRSLAREFPLGGVILFARNIVEPAQVAELVYEARALGGERPAWVSVDQEGGRVARLKRPFTEWPPAATLGRSGDAALARRFARALAAELLAVGISIDHAPVLDVRTNAKNTVIGDRALADTPDEVARLATAMIEEFQRAGLAACGKHFPGHGDTIADSHHDLPLVEHPPERLRAVEFEPFRAAVAAGVASLMTAHLLVPAFDEERPATLSPAILGVLRDELGFDEVVFSDDLNMKAIAGRMGVGEAAVQAIAAGCDAVLICAGSIDEQADALERLVRAVEDERIPYTRVDDALARHRRMRERFLTEPVGARRPRGARELAALVGTAEHQAIAEEMARWL